MIADGTPPTLLSYTHMISGCAWARNAEGAEKWFNKMLDAGIKPDRVAYNNLLQVYKDSQNVEKVEYWTKRMEEDGIDKKMKREPKRLAGRILSCADEAVRLMGKEGIKANLKEQSDMVMIKESMRCDRLQDVSKKPKSPINKKVTKTNASGKVGMPG